MEKHHEFKINWIGFPKTYRKTKGVYKIGNKEVVYIGASVHIRNRILTHIRKVNSIIKKAGFNIDFLDNKKDKYIANCILSGTEIDICYLSENPNEEEFYHILFGLKVSKHCKFFHQRSDLQKLLKNERKL